MPSKLKTLTQNQVYATIAIIVCAVVIAGIALTLFTNANRDRILDQNAEYLGGSTEQTARRVDDFLNNSLNNITVTASLMDRLIIDPDIRPAEMTSLVDSTDFDHFVFVTPTGMAYTSEGGTRDVSDQGFFLDGMSGYSGVTSILASDTSTAMMFYAPLHYDGEIVGLICGSYDEATLEDFLATDFFGERTATYLCDEDGSIVVSSSNSETTADNIFDLYAGNGLNDISLEELKRDFDNSVSVDFTYRSSSGLGSAYMMKLPSYDWLLLRTFPESITNTMIDNANRAGFFLMGGFGLVALLIIFALLYFNGRERRVLELEQQESHNIIDAATELFSGLIVVGLDDDEYVYLKGSCMGGEIPLEGNYAMLRNYWLSTAADSDKEMVDFYTDPERLKRSFDQHTPYQQYEYRTRREHEDHWLQVSNVPLLDESVDASSQTHKILIAVQDVTDAKAQELANRNALEDAFKAAEYASNAKSDFLNSMSHDIRTPMNSIMGMTAIAGMYVDDPERVQECLNNISSASKHLLGLINEVLDMAKIESGSIALADEPFDLPESIENLVTIVHPQIAAKHQDFKIELLGIEHEHVVGDPTRLQQIFVNIISNSIKFTPDGGIIGMSIKELPSNVPEYGYYEFVFTDNGCGMSEEFLEIIFEPFARANDSRLTNAEGTGLGMSIVKNIVNMMNGTIEVESEEGKGTTFTVAVHLKLRDSVPVDLSDLEGVRVLVVDDDEFTCEFAAEMLKSFGMDPSYALTGQLGIEQVAQAQDAGEPFRAIILDWRMPGMSGIETAKRIREISKNEVPIIILSGYDWSVIEEEAREIGVDAFISKPLFRSRLVQIMKDLLSSDASHHVDDRTKLNNLAYTDRRILLVEDNSMAAAIATEILELTGCTVDHAQNGQIAVDKLMDHEPGYYDLVLMDIQMPVMNGYDSTFAIREHGATDRPDLAEIPIVALSADAFSEDVNRTRSVGMNDHMAKPLEIDTLIRMLNKWM